MLVFLAAIGRLVTVLAALLTIAIASVVGWATAYSAQQVLGLPLYQQGDVRGAFAVIGGVIGFIVAGTAFGLVAAIYDTHRQTRRLVQVAERCEAFLRAAGPPNR